MNWVQTRMRSESPSMGRGTRHSRAAPLVLSARGRQLPVRTQGEGLPVSFRDLPSLHFLASVHVKQTGSLLGVAVHGQQAPAVRADDRRPVHPRTLQLSFYPTAGGVPNF